MELKQFIESALLDIMEGVKNAQGKCEDGSAVNPPVANSGAMGTSAKVVDVAFDVEIGAETEEKAGASIGVALKVLKGDAGTNATESERKTNRISFSIPIRLPQQKGEDYSKFKR